MKVIQCFLQNEELNQSASNPCTGVGKSFLHDPSKGELRQGLRVKKMRERDFITKINSANSQIHGSISHFSYKRDLNQNFRNKCIEFHTTQL